ERHARRTREERHVKTMKIGLQLGYWGSGPPPGAIDLVMEADRLGYDSVWTAESYGSDALTPLAWWGARTERVRLGTSLCQLSARTPTAMAMAALTMDHLSGGRFVLGQPLKPIVHPLRADIPVILGAEGPKNIALAAEIADGWFPIFFSPRAMSSFERSLDEGFARPGARRSAADFEVLA